ncbi:UDP-N-acetylglucosamine pyrophosphorylase, putative [Plasmodium knowlesi strain H]|uniref:UDP-N-acetylglucosamine diphosphorylase n=3 Tax=Plasmodium knowlesi TaxID=5850 RepID=A0A5K1UH98_PLAKH|nr:UDP-N-acetylglucosamine pyrophosphorylase, putative [Plasmodium knowlesi strain H]OTN66178.1 putative UDP-N-acetylglucosamine pyrophosphorylase [Plasmodium knowlesi]CAA9989903.1 UDP-N-acetylglucosamine pyrophosphorylase, putative [Plasmodium knowlesi strain H]SBO24469.1 UDP-N-acetylglucosamine pyrophosphorylase, putative [Plasmodium knowlesi strain H]SBO26516.1 UDP-N-acetylglucosamine pyrophosphorylase, putative [Plasmodium knowlesi strain H]VVS79377.1 UDP-N-acetylglucosamine pyrophosphoryl|eukprot:XP_002259919.1 UDP-N-acetylglucosamine pyrophosphorylase,putative [Plasmodium knowlesi strain H]
MDNILKVLTQQKQLSLCEYVKRIGLGNFKNLDPTYLNDFLNKLNDIRNAPSGKDEKNEGEDAMVEEYVLEAPPLINISSIQECNEEPPNGSIFIDTYKKAKLRNELKQMGLEIIKQSEVAVLILAGGMGSRLGFNKPKGLLEITPVLKKTFFQFYFEQVKFLEEYTVAVDTVPRSHDHANGENSMGCVNRSSERGDDSPKKNIPSNGTTIYVYVMTSEYTHDETINFLEEKNFFGLKKENVKFFKQSNNYATDFNYNIVLSNQNTLLTFPGGNGDVFRALDKNQIIEDMIRKKIKYIQVVSIDNVLNKICDPVLIGFCSFFHCDVANKAVKMEDVGSMGIFCLKRATKKEAHDNAMMNEFSVCEYTEVNEYILNNPELFIYGNICHHIFSLPFLHHIVKGKLYNHMKMHRIVRKRDYYNYEEDKNGDSPLVTSSPLYCYEYFIFDVFKYAKRILSLEVSIEDEFYPIKNNDNGMTILNAQKKLSHMHRAWLERMKFTIFPNPLENLNWCEISPLVSYDGTFFFNLPSQKNVHLPFVLDSTSSS